MQRPLKTARNIKWPPRQNKRSSSEKKSTLQFLGCMCSVTDSDGGGEESLPTSPTTCATFRLIDRNNNAKSRRSDTDSPDSDSHETSPITSEESSLSVSNPDDEEQSLAALHIMEPTPAIADLEAVCTIGTGTFGRVQLMRHRVSREHFALKILNMHKIVTTRQVEHVYNEKNILSMIDHPFIVKLHATERDERNLYMIMEFIPGGELFSYLRAARRFSLAMATFYAAEITSALAFLHSKNIVYRDLKPENLMLTKEGHIKMADFGFAKELRDRTYTMCGTPEYLAPESVAKKGHNKAVDWWALGILIYEMLVGRPPFMGKNAQAIYAAILEHNLKFPRSFDLVAKDLVRKLLEEERTHRLGCMKGGASDVMSHRFFSHLNWDHVDAMKLTPPIVPTLYHAGDTGNFDSYEENVDPGPIGTEDETRLFADW